jgi:hypothetical protein
MSCMLLCVPKKMYPCEFDKYVLLSAGIHILDHLTSMI